jgi:hypothetical protein
LQLKGQEKVQGCAIWSRSTIKPTRSCAATVVLCFTLTGQRSDSLTGHNDGGNNQLQRDRKATFMGVGSIKASSIDAQSFLQQDSSQAHQAATPVCCMQSQSFLVGGGRLPGTAPHGARSLEQLQPKSSTCFPSLYRCTSHRDPVTPCAPCPTSPSGGYLAFGRCMDESQVWSVLCTT